MLKYFDFINEGTTRADSEKVRKSNEIHKNFVDTIIDAVGKMDTNPDEVYQYIDDIMTEWKDEGMEWECELQTPIGREWYSVYHISLDEHSNKRHPHIPMYGGTEIDSMIIKALSNKDPRLPSSQLYYRLFYGYNRLNDVGINEIYKSINESNAKIIKKLKYQYQLLDIKGECYDSNDTIRNLSNHKSWVKFDPLSSQTPQSTKRSLYFRVRPL